MKLYFDTNVYDFIHEKQEAQSVREYLATKGYEVLASDINIYEIWAIPDRDLCTSQLSVLTSVANNYDSKPQSWRQANEVLSEVMKLRPYWIEKSPKVNLVLQEKMFLKSHLENWTRAKEPFIPPASQYAIYKRDYEKGIAKEAESQRALRQFILKYGNDLRINLVKQKDTDRHCLLSEDLPFGPENFWRFGCWKIFYDAIVKRIPESRDYADWLLPYIKDKSFTSPSYSVFWMENVRAEKVQKNRISSLVDFYQVKHKIGHGNFGDQMHACYLLDVDIFVTADKPYYKVLLDLDNHFPKHAKPILLDRSNSSALDELKKFI
ncbi:hypothetical protein LARV_00462 [Longilinea arvoryzae]|uniref:Uncharacterized protein n=1 Tax=Longilinea arvoryzae TaxID=360412 RepID=A0A0S7BE99_9CHLR|nr:hypothetical protein [Longilinea arvoryzae]GAP12726.1 hypothetical protein LARV_00462 [Longilinea arvoryzae]